MVLFVNWFSTYKGLEGSRCIDRVFDLRRRAALPSFLGLWLGCGAVLVSFAAFVEDMVSGMYL